MKKGPLSNKDKEYINENIFKGAKTLAKELDRSLQSVKNYFKTFKPEAVKDEPKSVEPTVSNLLARNEDRGVVVMTEAASMESDSNRKKTNEPPRRYKGVIHKIKKA